MRQIQASIVLQLRLSAASPDSYLICVTTPLLTTFIVLAGRWSGHQTPFADAVVAPTLMALWTLALSVAGNAITDDRLIGTLEAQLGAPASLAVTLFGRMCSVVLIGLVAFAEAWVAAGLLSGTSVPRIPHPVMLTCCLITSGLAAAGTATLLSPLYVLIPSARILQNTLSYPIYLLSGLAVPQSLFPEWLRIVTHLSFLTWSAQLMRASLVPAAIPSAPWTLMAIAVLGTAGFFVGTVLMRRMIERACREGTVVLT
ncbi:ABC transporter permease [Streptomyces tauricus]|uniref:ABC transporter permease n=1 Tax=Streptomyces tauricus TaxID=68274 RepID=A0ABZ1JUP1_9ACTN|nr:ABC transporter permease [Streptomyces tauricus]